MCGLSFLSFRSKLHLKEAVMKQTTPYSLVESYRPYWRKCCLHLLSRRWLQQCPPQRRQIYKCLHSGISAEGSILFSYFLSYPGRNISQEISEGLYNGYIIFAVYCFFLFCGILEIKQEETNFWRCALNLSYIKTDPNHKCSILLSVFGIHYNIPPLTWPPSGNTKKKEIFGSLNVTSIYDEH